MQPSWQGELLKGTFHVSIGTVQLCLHRLYGHTSVGGVDSFSISLICIAPAFLRSHATSTGCLHAEAGQWKPVKMSHFKCSGDVGLLPMCSVEMLR